MIKFIKQWLCNHHRDNAEFLTDEDKSGKLNAIKFNCRSCGKTTYEWRYFGNKKIIVMFSDRDPVND